MSLNSPQRVKDALHDPYQRRLVFRRSWGRAGQREGRVDPVQPVPNQCTCGTDQVREDP